MYENQLISLNINCRIYNKNGCTTKLVDSFYCNGKWSEFINKFNRSCFINNYIHSLIRKLDSFELPKGEYLTILSPIVASTLVHEAIGHGVEADLVLSGSVSSNYFGKKIAGEKVTIIDSGFSDQYDCPIYLPFDDEGILTKNSYIIDKGYLTNYLHDSRTSYLFQQENLGCSRAEDYSNESIVRMRNTFIKAGDFELNKMIKYVNNGLLINKVYSGQTDLNGEFMFSVIEAYLIKDGIITQNLNDFVMYGNSYKMVSDIECIGNQVFWNIGKCGKEQEVFVGLGAPYIVTKVMKK